MCVFVCFLLWTEDIHTAVLVSAVHIMKQLVYAHIPSLLSLPPTHPSPPLWVVTERRALLHSRFPLFTHGSVYRSMRVSPFVHSLGGWTYFPFFFFLLIVLLSKSSCFSYFLFFNWRTTTTILVLLFIASTIRLYAEFSY